MPLFYAPFLILWSLLGRWLAYVDLSVWVLCPCWQWCSPEASVVSRDIKHTGASVQGLACPRDSSSPRVTVTRLGASCQCIFGSVCQPPQHDAKRTPSTASRHSCLSSFGCGEMAERNFSPWRTNRCSLTQRQTTPAVDCGSKWHHVIKKKHCAYHSE